MTKSSFATQWFAALMAVSLLTVPGVALPQSQQSGQSGQTPQTSPPAATTPATTTPATSSSNQTVPQQDNPNVKAGSKQDVNAIGNRNVGKGLDFYSIEREIALTDKAKAILLKATSDAGPDWIAWRGSNATAGTRKPTAAKIRLKKTIATTFRNQTATPQAKSAAERTSPRPEKALRIFPVGEIT